MINERRLNLACGEVRIKDFFGIDIIKTEAADAIMDLEKYPWDIKSSSAEEIICEQFVEHLTDLISFMEEVHRILKPGGIIKIIAPYYTSIRCWQDPTHKRAISEETFRYFDRSWREKVNLKHYPIKTDFEVSHTFIFNPAWENVPDQERIFAMRHFWNVIDDIFITLKKR